jgi:hypothetical protein
MRGNNFKKFSIAELVWLEFGLGKKDKQKTFLSKQVFKVAATCCRMAYE